MKPYLESEEAVLSELGSSMQGLTEEEAAARLTELLDEARGLVPADGDEAFRLIRLRNDLLTALSAALSALERKESLGCHNRADHPEPPEKNYRVVVTLDGRGYPKAERMDLDQ